MGLIHMASTLQVLEPTFQSHGTTPCCLQIRTFIAPQAQERGTKQDERVNMVMLLRQICSKMVERDAHIKDPSDALTEMFHRTPLPRPPSS